MANEWEVARATGRCAVTGRSFAEGQAYYAALFENPTGFERRDYSTESWTGPPEGCFCYWRGRVPVRDKKGAVLTFDAETLTRLFLNLEEEESEARQQFRFVLALLLMRKRLLRFEGSHREGDREYWQMRLMADKSLHPVMNPRLTDEQVGRLSEQLKALLTDGVESFELLEPKPEEVCGPGVNDAGSTDEASGPAAEGGAAAG